jgi:hypothetical protein
MKKLLIYILIAGLVGCIFSVAMQDAGKSELNSSVTSLISNVGVGVVYADTVSGPHPPPPPPPIPK